MIIRVILLALAIFVLLNLVSYIKRQPPLQRKVILLKYSGYAIAAVALLLAATGRLHWIGALIAMIFPFAKAIGGFALRYFPFLKWIHQQKFGNSVLNTRFLRIVVVATSGKIEGEIIAGEHQGSTLDSLSENQLKELLLIYQQQDSESARLLSVYMAKRFNQHYGQNQQSGSAETNSLNRKEALQILGLGDNADDKDVIRAHRSLIQKVHPDRGGSDYLAAKINQAKDFLLKQ